jgi:acetate kinase
VRTLVVNAGSSSLKLRVVDGGALVGSTDLAAPGGLVADDVLSGAVEALGAVDATGHRVVHGGTELTAATRLDGRVVAALTALVPLAPIHQPPALAAIATVARVHPEVPAVACFDTGFHAHLPPAAATYALPAAWRERFPLRRFGFHGLAHAWNGRRVAELVGGDVEQLRVVSCHLGGGASLAALVGGRSVDTTMGFTPLEGLVMATRAGSVDPGLVLWLMGEGGLSVAEVTDGLQHGAGLAGLAGSDDMREVVGRAAGGDRDAQLALDVYGHRLRGHCAAMAAALGGLDVLVFSGGVGERAPTVRADAARGLDFLGIGIDEAANLDAVPDVEIGSAEAPVRTFVVAAREDLEIARQVEDVLGGGLSRSSPG